VSSVIRIRDLTKSFGDVIAVDSLNLDITTGEFFSMLGPSGSGKTTVLRAIAGFELPDSGSVAINGVDVTATPPFGRNVNTVFQDYALFPHMTVLDNVAYGLRVRKMGKEERNRKAEQALERVQLAGFGSRLPSQLSGGQRQRVALARATVLEPQVLLLDEPLGALDLKLRQEMQIELKQLQRDLGITFVFVTHDQEEALSMSDRIAVFRGGRIEQIGTPEEIYRSPATEFVADFVGTSNLFSIEEARESLGEEHALAIRPERINLGSGDSHHYTVEAFVQEIVFSGSTNKVWAVLSSGKTLVVSVPGADSDSIPSRGAPVTLSWKKTDVVAFG